MARRTGIAAAYLMLAALVASVSMGAATTALAETRIALVIGNGAYASTAALPNPPNDARDVAAALKSTDFDVIEAIDADRRAMDGALRAFAEKLGSADVALFFYAGHGLQVGAQNYLVPTDAKLARERDLEFEAIRVDFVLRQMEIDRDGKTSIVVLDACRDNPLARNLARSMGTRSASIGRGLAPASTGVGTFIAFATQPGNVALDGDGRNSPFTQALVRHMRVAGQNLPATMVAVRKDVIAATGGKQVPWDHSALTGDFYFVPGSPAPAQGQTTTVAPAGGADLAALQERLRRLEEEAKARQSAAPDTMAAAMKLAELRARAAGLDDLVKELTRKLLTARMEEGKAPDPAEKQARVKRSMDIQMELTRRSLELKRLRDEMAGLDATAAPADKQSAATAALPPVTPKPDRNASAADFEAADNVRLTGTELRSFKAASPDACRNACAEDAACAAYQHGRKLPAMGTCTLFSAVTARHEDEKWRSGTRRTAAAKITLSGAITPTQRGFVTSRGQLLKGEVIKEAQADGIAGCLVTCFNTPGCIAAAHDSSQGPSCSVLRSVTDVIPRNTATAIVHGDLVAR